MCEKEPQVPGIFTGYSRTHLALGSSIVDNRDMERTLLVFSRARVRQQTLKARREKPRTRNVFRVVIVSAGQESYAGY